MIQIAAARTHALFRFLPSNRSRTLDGLCFKIVRHSVATIQITFRLDCLQQIRRHARSALRLPIANLSHFGIVYSISSRPLIRDLVPYRSRWYHS